VSSSLKKRGIVQLGVNTEGKKCGNQSTVYMLPNSTHKEGACSSTVSQGKAISLSLIMSFPFMYSVENIPQVCLYYWREK
jgi:hypothetical protein